MKMNDIHDDVDLLTPQAEVPSGADVGEQKVLALMEQMQIQAQQGQIEDIDKVQERNTQLLNINTEPEDTSNFWEVTGLPTKGRLYPEGTVIKARPLKVLEVKKLTSLNEYNADAIINDILRKCVRGIDVNEIYTGDKLYLIFWLRANSFRDNDYVVDYVCPKCEKDSTYHFNIDCVNIAHISDEYDPNHEMALSNGDAVNIGLMKLKDEVGIASFKERYTDLIMKSGDDVEEELLALAIMINTINGKHIDPLSKYNYILGLSAQDYASLSTYVEDTMVTVKSYMNVTCDKCGGESQIGISFRPNFFLPKYRA